MNRLDEALQSVLEEVPPPPELSDLRKRARRRQRTLGAIAVVVTAAVISGASGLVLRAQHHVIVSTVTPESTTTTTTMVPIDAQQLIAGHWQHLPAAPTSGGEFAAWTGKEMLVWGATANASDRPFRSSGEAYNPRLERWRRLPPAPLVPRLDQAAVWTGTELVIWGGYIDSAENSVGDGAAYDPTTNTWRTLPPAPLEPQGDAIAIAVASDGNAVVLSGRSTAGAILDTKTNRWRALPSPPVHDGRSRTWLRAVSIGDGQFLAWAHWDYRKQISPNSSELGGGTDLFRYNTNTNAWTAVAAAAGSIPDVEEAFWTGTAVLVRGDGQACFICSGPPASETSAWYDPATNRWTALPADALAPKDQVGANNLESIWTGAALWSFNQGTSIGGPVNIAPGDASVYDPAIQHWTRVHPAPNECDSTINPVWTGSEIILYCASGSHAGSGLAYIPAVHQASVTLGDSHRRAP